MPSSHELQRQAIKIWHHRATNPTWQEDITNCLTQSLQENTDKSRLITETGWHAAWITFLCRDPEACAKTWGYMFYKTCTTESVVTNRMLHDTEENLLNQALTENPPSPAIAETLITLPQNMDASQTSEKIHPKTWLHYTPILDPARTLKNIHCDNIIEILAAFPKSPIWQAGARKAMKFLCQKSKVPMARLSLLIAIYPEAWNQIPEKTRQQTLPTSQYASLPLEQIPETAIREWATTDTLKYVRNTSGDIIKIKDINQTLIEKTDVWQDREIKLRYNTLIIQNNQISQSGTVFGWRFGPNTVFVKDDRHKTAMEGAGFTLLSLQELVKGDQLGNPYCHIVTHLTNTIDLTLRANADKIGRGLASIKMLSEAALATDNLQLKETIREIVGAALLIEEIRMQADPQVTKEDIDAYRQIRRQTRGIHPIPQALLAMLL